MLFWLIAFAAAGCAGALNVFVAGGTGFVGSKMVERLVQRGHVVTSLSRRGAPSSSSSSSSSASGGSQGSGSVTYVRGDAGDFQTVEDVFSKFGPFDSCFHCVGLLLDNQSGLSGLNKFASGSGSVPGSDSSYDKVTRQTAFNLLDALLSQPRVQASRQIAFIFVSAAEAAWTFPAPVQFLQRYLEAKRAVEKRLQESRALVRPIILRPSLIYTLERPQALISVVPFYLGNLVGLPFVDRPVRVETLVNAAVFGMENDAVSGIQTFREMEALSAKAARA